MTNVTEHAWGLRGRLLDLPRHQLDLVAADIADLPADDPAAQARDVRRAQKILDLRAAGRVDRPGGPAHARLGACPVKKPNRATRKAQRQADAIARQQRLIQRGYYLRLADPGSRKRGYIACTPAPITEFTRTTR